MASPITAGSVCVSGAAATTCCGTGVEAFCSRVAGLSDPSLPRSGASAPETISISLQLRRSPRLLDADRLTAQVLAAVDHDLGTFLRELSDQEREHVGVALGSAYGHLSNYLAYLKTGTEHGYQLVNPRLFPTTLSNWSAVSVSDAYSLFGSSTPINSGLSAGLEAIAYAAQAIRDGEEQSMIAGGYDELTPYNARVLEASTATGCVGPRLQAHKGKVRPGEGVGLLLLQSFDAAKHSNRKPLAEYGATVILHDMCPETPHAVARAAEAVTTAVVESGLRLNDIAAVFPSASGSPAAEQLEVQLLRELFGARLSALDILPIKTVTGECFAASGPLQCVAAVEYLAHTTSPQLLSDRTGVLISALGYDGTYAATVFTRSPA